LDIISVTQPSHGTTTYNIDYVYYTPNTNYNGPDQFNYTITDNNGGTDIATVYITVGGVNDPPNANDDTATVPEDSNNNQINVLANDNDPDGDNIDIVGVTQPTHGTTTYNIDYVYYTPNTNYNGQDQFNYTITDNNGEIDTAFVNITITPLNDPPYIPSNPSPNDGQTDVNINSNLSWTGGDLDGDPVTYDIYFGITSSPPKVVSNQSDTTYYPATLNYSTKYYWKIVAWDNQGVSTTGPIWNFTTEGEHDWDCILTFEEPGGGYDNVYFGEKDSASDDQDIYDVPKSSGGVPPFIRAWFETDFVDPYDELWKEYKQYPDDYKQWNLTIEWIPSDSSSPTDITISWNSFYLSNSEYNSVFIKNSASGEMINMFMEENYSFNASALTQYQFKILCSNVLQITELHTQWNIMSLPFNQSVSKSNLTVNYEGTNYTWQEAVNNNIILGFIYSWKRTAPQHYELTDILEPGYGYWIYAFQNCTLLAEGASTMNNDGYITNMFLNWNVIGLPNIVSLSKEDLIINYNGVYYSWLNATTNNNPTGGPIILGYIYNWSRNLPQHYELTNVFYPGYGYHMYAFYNCSLYYNVINPLGKLPLVSKDNLIEPLLLKDQISKQEKNNNNIKWNATLTFNEPGGAYNNVFFGEKSDASEFIDSYDIPRNPCGISPLIKVWFDTGFSEPYDKLWEDYKHYPDNYKSWNLTFQWVPSDSSSPTTITISWDNNTFNDIEYSSVVLFDVIKNVKVANMLVNTSHTFICPALALQKFKIICTTKQPLAIPDNPYPNDDAIGVDIQTNLSWISIDSDYSNTLTYDIYFGTNNNPPLIQSNWPSNYYDSDTMSYNTTYYWRIVAWADQGASTSSPIWHFTTKESNVQVTTIKKISSNIIYSTQTTIMQKLLNIDNYS